MFRNVRFSICPCTLSQGPRITKDTSLGFAPNAMGAEPVLSLFGEAGGPRARKTNRCRSGCETDSFPVVPVRVGSVGSLNMDSGQPQFGQWATLNIVNMDSQRGQPQYGRINM
jgi:hypothetical protein